MLGAPFRAPAALARHLQAFVRAGTGAGPSEVLVSGLPQPLDLAAQLSVGDQCRIRDRSTILARHMFAEMGEGFADQQVCVQV